jgi:cell division protease FtsH
LLHGRQAHPPPAAPADAAKPHTPTPWRVEGSRRPPPPGAKPGTTPPHRRPSLWLILAIALSINLAFSLAIRPGTRAVTVPYSVFRSQAQVGNVATVSSRADTIQGTFRKAVRYPAAAKSAKTKFKTERPAFADDKILSLLLSKNTVVNAKPAGLPRVRPEAQAPESINGPEPVTA